MITVTFELPEGAELVVEPSARVPSVDWTWSGHAQAVDLSGARRVELAP